MEHSFAVAAQWLGLALLATFAASRLHIPIALMEIVMGVVAAAVLARYSGSEGVGSSLPWLTFIANSGAVLLTFLAGAELEHAVMIRKWKEVTLVGLIGFFTPFFGCAALARYVLHWSGSASWLAGIALSTTSMAVVYAVMLETGFNSTDFGKGVLGSCFVNDLGTVIALGLVFSPFNTRTVVFLAVSAGAFFLLPSVTSVLVDRYANRTAAFRTKWTLFLLFALGSLALWAGSEAVLPAYIAGIVLARTIGTDHAFVRRLRTLTVGFLSPFYFLRAGSLVSLSSLIEAPLAFLILLGGKVVSKVFGLFPVIAGFYADGSERWYYALMMSTGLTFGTISALYGLSHSIVTPQQYSHLVAVVIGSAVAPTMVANAAFMPRHLLCEEPSRSAARARPPVAVLEAEPLEEG